MLRLVARVAVVTVLSVAPLLGQGGNSAFSGSVVISLGRAARRYRDSY